MPLNQPRKTFISRSKSRAKRNPFLRSIGFEVPFIFGSSHNDGEKPKIIVQTSRALALARCGIHILPILVSITVLILNFGHAYTGRTLPGSIIDPSINIALLQVAAKIQELLMVASTTTIVMHVLRAELTTGQGLPLGFVGGGFLFTGLGYFWSPEFWGSFYTRWSIGARCRVYGIVLVGGLIAALAGPSTAVLLVPKDQPWPAGGTAIFVPGPTTDWWPSYVNPNNSIKVITDQAQPSMTAIKLTPTASSAIWSVGSSIDILGQKAYVEGSLQNLTSGFTFGPFSVDVPSQVESIRSFRYHGSHRGYACETTAWGPRAATALLQARLKQDWIDEAFAIPYSWLKYGVSLIEYKYFGSMEVSTATLIPATRAACLPAQVVPFTQNTILFPKISANPCWTSDSLFSADVSNSSMTKINQLRTTWLSVPDPTGFASGGLMLELPSILNESSRAVVACSLDSRWTNGSITTYHLDDANGLEKLARAIIVSTALLKNSVPASGWSPGYSDFAPVVKSSSSQRITFDESWLASLARNTSLAEPQQVGGDQGVLEDMLKDLAYVDGKAVPAQAQADKWNQVTLGRVNRTVALEWWLALLVTDGLSRFGTPTVMNMTGVQSEWSLLNYLKAPDFQKKLFNSQNALLPPKFISTIEEKVGITIGGYSYRASSITDYASAALLLTHMLMALAHTIYTVGWSRRSSSAWDSLTELMVLMQNSRPPATVLSNTSAGVADLKTYGRRARIMAVSTDEEPGGKRRVELVFDDDYGTQASIIQVRGEIGPGHLTRTRRLESLSSINSESMLLKDNELSDLQQTNSTSSHHSSNDGTNTRRRRVLDKIVPDTEY